jgi:uncharacterized damage-inducible protein DinB
MGIGNSTSASTNETGERLEWLRHFVNYDNWANKEVLAAFREAHPLPQRPLQLMAHIIGAEFIWWSRIKGTQAPLAVWAELSLDECEKHVAELFALWSDYLKQLRPDQLSNVVNYKNSKGEPWGSSIQDIIVHVAFHSTYHRGQIAAEMRAAGFTPAYTDYIQGVRTGAIG